jgi:pyrroline-5-carboxylate reductase
MARALLQPLLHQGLVPLSGVQAAVASAQSAQRLTDELGIAVSTDPAAAWRAPLVLLAVKPQQLEAAVDQATHGHGPGSGLLISVLAGVRLARLEALFPTRQCVRAVPNTPAQVKAGLTGLAFGSGFDANQRSRVDQLFSLVGEVHTLPEQQLDAFLALTSSGPAFLALVAEAMADGAVACGLPRQLAHQLTHRTLAGTAALLGDQCLHPAVLKDQVSSPGGTTIAGLRVLEQASVRAGLIEAIVAAAERSRELS